MSARSSGRSVPSVTKCQGPGLAKARPVRALSAAELAAVDEALTPWARRRAAELLERGTLGHRQRQEEVAAVVAEVVDQLPRETPTEERRRLAAGQVRMPWSPPARGDWGPAPPTERVREITVLSVQHTHRWGVKWNPWHASRAESLQRGLVRKLAKCGSRELACACKRCRRVHVVHSKCDDRFCFDCSKVFYGRLRKRLIAASHAQMRAAWTREKGVRVAVGTCAKCGRQHPKHATGRSRPQLWTLTVAHGASAEETRRRITKAWVRLRAWLHYETGRALPYALVWEWTRGSGEHGAHVHAHVLVIAPPMCWQALSAEWRRATDGHGRGVGHPKMAGKAQGAAVAATAAARYIAKYASKGSAVYEDEGVDPGMLAEVWASSYARRRVTASRGFWVSWSSVTPCCLKQWTVLASWGAAEKERLEGAFQHVGGSTGPPE